MDQLQQVLTIGLAIVSIATVAGLGLLRGTVTNLREQLSDERANNVSLKAQRAEDRDKITKLEGDVRTLTSVVTGEAVLKELLTKLDEHHEAAAEHWRRQDETAASAIALLQGGQSHG